MRPVRWGVLSTAQIGLEKVLPAMMRSPLCEVVAVASRDAGRAAQAAGSLGIARSYGSYEALLDDSRVEAVYNPLPNHLHVPWTLRAAASGRHVLCEKPFALSAAEARTVLEAGRSVHIMEAFMVRFHPQWLRAQQWVREGRLGDLRLVNMLFSFANRDPANIRNMAAAGGGALYDIGCYAIVAGRFFFEAEPLRAIGLVDRDPEFGTDRLASAVLDFGEGRQLVFAVSTQSSRYQRLHLCGTRARAEMEIPVNAPADEVTRLWLDEGRGPSGVQEERVPECDQYRLQGEAFARAVLGEAPLPYGVEDAVLNLRIIDALKRSEHSGRWETPSAGV